MSWNSVVGDISKIRNDPVMARIKTPEVVEEFVINRNKDS
jgi:hypothetical protein